MKIVDIAVKKVYRFNCPNCQSRLEADSKEVVDIGGKVNLNFQNHVLVVAQDIDEIVALMCYIQLSLLGVAAYIKVGDVFTQPMSTDDNGENYWFTMMYFSDVWTMRRVFHSL